MNLFQVQDREKKNLQELNLLISLLKQPQKNTYINKKFQGIFLNFIKNTIELQSIMNYDNEKQIQMNQVMLLNLKKNPYQLKYQFQEPCDLDLYIEANNNKMIFNRIYINNLPKKQINLNKTNENEEFQDQILNIIEQLLQVNRQNKAHQFNKKQEDLIILNFISLQIDFNLESYMGLIDLCF